MKPPVTVLIYTYNRPELIRLTLQGFVGHLKYGGELVWRLADDGSPPGYLESIAADFPELKLEWTVTDRKGFGANANKGLHAQTSRYIFASEDDWEATRTIDLDAGVTLMEGVPEIGAVRYDAKTDTIFLSGHTLRMGKSWIGYWIFDRRRSRYWYFCGHPTLFRSSFYEAYGYFPEGVCVGETELAWSRRTSKMEGPEVAIMTAYLGLRPGNNLGKAFKLSGTPQDAGWMIQKGLVPK